MVDEGKKIEFVSVGNLRFDPDNPRLPSTIDGNDQAAVVDWMLMNESIIELMGSIGEHDYFPGEPLLVVETSKRGIYATVEGNRRLAAVKLLMEPALASTRKLSVKEASESAKYKPATLPVLAFGSRDEILDYLGYRHITGIKEWDPLAKARYLEQLAKRANGRPTLQEFQALAKSIGSRADYVARLLTGLAVYKRIADSDFFEIKGLNEESFRFTLLTTALSYNTLVEFLGLETAANPSLKGLKRTRLKELTGWLFEKNAEGKTRLGESRNLEDLSAIVERENALKAFRNGASLRDAALLTQMPTEAFREAIFDARARLQIARDNIHLVDNPTQSDFDTLSDVRRIATDLRTLVRERLTEQEEV